MLLTAQRVVSPTTGQHGINAFCYLHYTAWLGAAPPEVRTNSGVLANSRVEVPPPGNRVRSYLDILAPDVTPNAQIYHYVLNPIQLLADTRPLPWNITSGDTTFSFNVEELLAPGWYSELTTLLNYALAVRVPH